MLYIVIAALALVVIACAVPLMRRSSGVYEVDRFHHARTLTSQWAAQPQPNVRVPAQGTVADD